MEANIPAQARSSKWGWTLISLRRIDLLSLIPQTPSSFDFKLVQYFKTNLKPIFELFFLILH